MQGEFGQVVVHVDSIQRLETSAARRWAVARIPGVSPAWIVWRIRSWEKRNRARPPPTSSSSPAATASPNRSSSLIRCGIVVPAKGLGIELVPEYGGYVEEPSQRWVQARQSTLDQNPNLRRNHGPGDACPDVSVGPGPQQAQCLAEKQWIAVGVTMQTLNDRCRCGRSRCCLDEASDFGNIEALQGQGNRGRGPLQFGQRRGDPIIRRQFDIPVCGQNEYAAAAQVIGDEPE
jgi:hypothetical protein